MIFSSISAQANAVRNHAVYSGSKVAVEGVGEVLRNRFRAEGDHCECDGSGWG